MLLSQDELNDNDFYTFKQQAQLEYHNTTHQTD